MIEVLIANKNGVDSLIHFDGDDTRGSDVHGRPGPHRLLLTLKEGVFSVLWADGMEPCLIKEEVTPL